MFHLDLFFNRENRFDAVSTRMVSITHAVDVCTLTPKGIRSSMTIIRTWYIAQGIESIIWIEKYDCWLIHVDGEGSATTIQCLFC